MNFKAHKSKTSGKNYKRKNIRENIWYLRLSKEFLDLMPKA